MRSSSCLSAPVQISNAMQTSTPLRASHAAFEDDSLSAPDASLILGPDHSNIFLPVLTPPPQRADSSVRPSRLFDLEPSALQNGVPNEQAIQALRAQLDTQRALVVQFEVDLDLSRGPHRVHFINDLGEDGFHGDVRTAFQGDPAAQATAGEIEGVIDQVRHLGDASFDHIDRHGLIFVQRAVSE